MLSQERVEQIFTLNAAGWSGRAIAKHLGHAPNTVRDYLNGRRTAGVRAVSRPDHFTDLFADYCRQRLTEDPYLQRSRLFQEAIELGFQGSRATFYRGLKRHLSSPPGRPQAPAQPGTAQSPPGTPRRPSTHAPVLPLPATPVTGETLASYLTRLARANHLTLAELLAVLPPWFSTKINNRDDRAQHHMLAPATTQALNALAHLTHATPDGLAHALPAFGTASPQRPVRATTACHRCTARRGIHQPVPVHLPVHHMACTRHGIWLGDPEQPHLDLAACPEIITAQHRINRLLRRYTPQQVKLAQQAAISATPSWPASPDAITLHWRHRLLVLQTANHHRGIPTDHDTYTHAAIYPDTVSLATAMLKLGRIPSGPND